jgi:hypothetical protein
MFDNSDLALHLNARLQYTKGLCMRSINNGFNRIYE